LYAHAFAYLPTAVTVGIEFDFDGPFLPGRDLPRAGGGRAPSAGFDIEDLKGCTTSVVKHKPVHDLVALHDRLKFENAFGQKRLRPERRRIGRRTENRDKNHIHDAEEQQFFSQ
jgi:hypothetical protein